MLNFDTYLRDFFSSHLGLRLQENAPVDNANACGE
jgi:hypothetical protein